MGLHRPYIRVGTRKVVEERAQKNVNGQFLDANTNQPIEGHYDLGHKAGHEFRKEVAAAEEKGMSQEEFNEEMNNPDLYQIEDPSVNRSHVFEEKDEESGKVSGQEYTPEEGQEAEQPDNGEGETLAAEEGVGNGMDMGVDL